MLNYLFDRCHPYGGPGFEVQIDEALMRGERKYKTGRCLLGNGPVDLVDLSFQSSRWKRNFGNRVKGPWVFGLGVQKTSDI